MCFFSLNIAFSCIDALLHSFEIWSSNDNWLSIVIPKRVTKFSDLISLLSIWSFSWITFFVDFCRSINWDFSGFTIMLLFLNQFTGDSDSFFNVSNNVSLFFGCNWDCIVICKIINIRILWYLSQVIKEYIKKDRTDDRHFRYSRDQNLQRAKDVVYSYSFLLLLKYE